MQVRWLRKALHNLDEEATYISADDLPVDLERILQAVAPLAEQLGIGRPGRVHRTAN